MEGRASTSLLLRSLHRCTHQLSRRAPRISILAARLTRACTDTMPRQVCSSDSACQLQNSRCSMTRDTWSYDHPNTTSLVCTCAKLRSACVRHNLTMAAESTSHYYTAVSIASLTDFSCFCHHKQRSCMHSRLFPPEWRPLVRQLLLSRHPGKGTRCTKFRSRSHHCP